MANKEFFIFIVLFFASVSFYSGCNSTAEKEKHPFLEQMKPKTSEALKQILRNVPITSINIDDFPTDTIRAYDKNVMAFPASAKDPLLGKVVGMIVIGDSFYVADFQQPSILIMDKAGKLYRKIGRRGSGPGEFKRIVTITRNDHYVFVPDLKKSKLQIFDLHFNFITSYIGNFIRFIQSIAVNNSMLFMKASLKDTTYLIEVRQAHPPWDVTGSFFPRLIPYGYQTAFYNTYLISVNSKGKIIVAYRGLPFIFVYDKKLQHIKTFAIHSQIYKSLNNPPVIPIHAERIHMTNYFGSIDIKDNGDIFFRIKDNLYRLKDTQSGYKLTGKWVFIYMKEKIYVDQILFEDSYFYIRANFGSHIFKFDKSKLIN